MVRKRPGTSALAVVALSLGIGLTTTMFSIVQGVILRGLPFPESDRILAVGRVTAGQPDRRPSSTSLHDFVDWRSSQQSFEGLSAFSNGSATITGGLAPQRYRLSRITPNTLGLLRVAPALGRDFTDADGAPGAPAVVLISHDIWTSQFQSDPDAINRVVRVNSLPATIVGVMPPRFGFPNSQQMWMPLQVAMPATRGEGMFVDVIGRLKPTVSIPRAATEMAAIARRLQDAHPENRNVDAAIVPYIRRFIGPEIIDTFYAMLAAVFGVMLIACANVATLQLARAAERTREVAVRIALGAPRGRVVRQLLIEGLLLSTAGAVLGVGIASVGTDLFTRSIGDTSPPFWIDIRLDGTVLAFVSALTMVSAIAASLVPALRVTRADVNSVLKDESRGSTGLSMGRFSRSLVVVEVLLSCCLLVVSGLMIKGVISLDRITYPYATGDVFVGGLSAPDATYPDDASKATMLARLDARIASVPGVGSAALSTGLPENLGTTPLAVEGVTYAAGEQPRVRRMAISAHFFDTLRIAVERGRVFRSSDRIGAEPVVIVGQDLATRYFAATDPVGRRVRLGSETTAPWLTIVGVAPSLASARTNGVREIAYVPLAQFPQNNVTILALTMLAPVSLAPAVRGAVLELDQDMALSNPTSLAAEYRQNGWHYRVFGTLFMSFGLAALLLASAGLYGVMAFSVRRRTNEIGVRMALGASRGRIVRMVLAQGLWRCALGVALGLIPAWWLGNAMTELLFNVRPFDPTVWSVTIAGLMTAGFAASVAPAMRAASVDPLVALRRD